MTRFHDSKVDTKLFMQLQDQRPFYLEIRI